MVAEIANPFASVPRPAHVPPELVVDWDIYNPPKVAQGFHAAWKTLQEGNLPDVIWTPCNGGHWMAIRGQALYEIFTDYQTFSSRNLIVPKALAEQHKLLPTTLDPPEHKGYRAIINPPFTPKRVAAYEAKVREVAVDLIDSFVARGACNFTTAYAEQLPIRVFLAMVDLPMSDAPRLKYLADQVTRPDGSMTFLEAIRGLDNYIKPYIEKRRTNPGDDMLSGIVNAKVDGRELTMDECLKLRTQLLIAGLDTVVNLLGFMMMFLARNDAHRLRPPQQPALELRSWPAPLRRRAARPPRTARHAGGMAEADPRVRHRAGRHARAAGRHRRLREGGAAGVEIERRLTRVRILRMGCLVFLTVAPYVLGAGQKPGKYPGNFNSRARRITPGGIVNAPGRSANRVAGGDRDDVYGSHVHRQGRQGVHRPTRRRQ
jgi:hypothetical protein